MPANDLTDDDDVAPEVKARAAARAAYYRQAEADMIKAQDAHIEKMKAWQAKHADDPVLEYRHHRGPGATSP